MDAGLIFMEAISCRVGRVPPLTPKVFQTVCKDNTGMHFHFNRHLTVLSSCSNVNFLCVQLPSYLQSVPVGSQSHTFSASITGEIHTSCRGRLANSAKESNSPIFHSLMPLRLIRIFLIPFQLLGEIHN